MLTYCFLFSTFLIRILQPFELFTDKQCITFFLPFSSGIILLLLFSAYKCAYSVSENRFLWVYPLKLTKIRSLSEIYCSWLGGPNETLGNWTAVHTGSAVCKANSALLLHHLSSLAKSYFKLRCLYIFCPMYSCSLNIISSHLLSSYVLEDLENC